MQRLLIRASCAMLVALCACGSGDSVATPVTPDPPPGPVVPPEVGQTYVPTGRAAAGDVAVHLFEWRWADIARECEVWLGPKGFRAVQISPPNEHAVIRQGGADFPWWQRYQPVSYRLESSRSGTAAELAAMVARCKAVGVDIYADAVINHMTAGSGTGSAGSVYTKYGYPAVPYAAGDFNPACNIESYTSAAQVQNCELVGLSDLRTAADTVRGRIARYLIALNEIGITGFRIDAAKHIPPRDLEAIVTRVNAAAVASGRPRPYIFLEVINNPGEAVTAQQYFGVGYASGGAADLTDFLYGYRVTDAFLGRNGATLSSTMETITTALLPSDKSVVFVDNHDNQRGANLYYASANYELAVVFMLAHPQGYPSVMSSFGFDRFSQGGRDTGPPSDAAGNTLSTFEPSGASRCTAGIGSPQLTSWICEHRRPAIANMVAFRKASAGAPLSNCGRSDSRVANDANRIAFCRDGAGFVVINLSAAVTVIQLQTRLPAGRYCNVAQFEFVAAVGVVPASCTGDAIVVQVDGTAAISLGTRSAIALHTRARVN